VHLFSQEQIYLLLDNLVILAQMNLFLKVLFLFLQKSSHFIGREGSLGHVDMLSWLSPGLLKFCLVFLGLRTMTGGIP